MALHTSLTTTEIVWVVGDSGSRQISLRHTGFHWLDGVGSARASNQVREAPCNAYESCLSSSSCKTMKKSFILKADLSGMTFVLKSVLNQFHLTLANIRDLHYPTHTIIKACFWSFNYFSGVYFELMKIL